MLPIKTILHPTDSSHRAEYAFHLACALARDYNARLLITYVEAPSAAMYSEVGVMMAEAIDFEEVMRERLAQARPTDDDIACEHIFLIGDPAAEIVRLAKDRHVDLVVMGTHGRRGLDRLLMGSVAEQVVRKANCPVLTVKALVADTAPTTEHGEHAAV